MKNKLSNKVFGFISLYKLKMFSLFIFSCTLLYSHAQTIQLGSGTTTSPVVPVSTNWGYTYSQTIYTAAEMLAQGASPSGAIINKIRFRTPNTYDITTSKDWVVYLANSSKVGFTSITDWVPLANLTEVFNGSVNTTITGGQWFEITLSTPFIWDGASNIVLAVDENTSSYADAVSWYSYTLTPSTGEKALLYRSDSANPNPSSPGSGSRTSNVAQIQFELAPLTSCSGMPNAGTTNLSATSGNVNTPFTGNLQGATSASGLTYQWQYSDDNGTSWNDIAGQTTAALSTTAMATFGTRQYRCVVSCGGDVAYSTPATFTTQLTYCVPTTTNSGDYTSAFSTTNAIQNVTYTGTSNTAYVNKSGVDTIKAVIGNSFDFSHTYVGGSNTLGIWVDWNLDGSFDATENVYSLYSSALTKNGTITIPGTTLAGNYRMRVRSSFSSTTQTTCGNMTYGSTIDYTLTAVSLPVSPTISQEATAPTCADGTDLSTTGSPTANEAWYWQTNATGTDMTNVATTPWTVYENGTYYVRAYNTVYNVWGDADSITITNMPSIADPSAPQALQNPACAPGTQITVPNQVVGTSYYWQGTSNTSSNTTEDAANPYNVTATGTYYVKAYDPVSQCWSAAVGTLVTIGTVIPEIPTVTQSEIIECINVPSINLEATSATTNAIINWYDAATAGNNIGGGSPLEAVGTAVLPNTSVADTFSFYAEAYLDGCVSTTRTQVTVELYTVNVELVAVDASCNNGADGSFVLSNVHCGTAPFTYAVDGASTFGAIPTDLSIGQHTVVVKDNAGNTSASYTFTINGAAAPSDLVISSINNSQATVNWVANGAETSWTIEWGAPGFTPGTGTQIGTANAVDTFFTISGLDGDTDYDVYVTTNCGGAYVDWGTISAHTSCNPIPALGYCEDFESTDALNCWTVIDANDDGDTWGINEYNSNSGSNSLSIDTYYAGNENDDYVVLPMMTLTGNEVMSFFYKADLSSYPNDFEILVSTTGTNPTDFTNVIYTDTVSNDEFQDTTVNLSALVGDVYIAFHIPNGTLAGWGLYIDDVCINICTPVAGTDGSADVCRSEGTINLNDVITSQYTTGTWYFNGNQSLIDDSILNVSILADGTYNLNYVVVGACTSDTTVATINIFNPSSAGVNGLINACKNQPIDLFGALSGNVDFGGTWYKPNGTAMTGSYFTTGTLMGQQVYKYIVSNGICDADTAEVTVNITNCDYAGVEEVTLLNNVVIAPNPSNGTFQITGIPGTGFTYEIHDLNGRLVKVAEKITSSQTTVNISSVENGVYLVRISGESSEKVIRVIKN